MYGICIYKTTWLLGYEYMQLGYEPKIEPHI